MRLMNTLRVDEFTFRRREEKTKLAQKREEKSISQQIVAIASTKLQSASVPKSNWFRIRQRLIYHEINRRYISIWCVSSLRSIFSLFAEKFISIFAWHLDKSQNTNRTRLTQNETKGNDKVRYLRWCNLFNYFRHDFCVRSNCFALIFDENFSFLHFSKYRRTSGFSR